jgi:L-fuconate dehydratase
MAKKFNLPVWPHAGGVGLCEYVQHLSMIDYIVISGEKDTKRIEYVDHLHEHFINPCILKQGAYMPPNNPGFSIQMKKKSINKWQFKVKK